VESSSFNINIYTKLYKKHNYYNDEVITIKQTIEDYKKYMTIYQKTNDTKNYNCSLHDVIFWKRCKIFSFSTLSNISLSMYVTKQPFKNSSPIRLRIWFFTKFIAEKLLSTVVVSTDKSNANFKSNNKQLTGD